MVGFIVFVLGLTVVGIAAAAQLGEVYCLIVAVAWFIFLMNSSQKNKLKKTSPQNPGLPPDSSIAFHS